MLNALQRHRPQNACGVFARICAIGEQIVQIEQQVAGGRIQDVIDPRPFAVGAERRPDQRRDIFEDRRATNDMRRLANIADRAVDRLIVTGRRREMADLVTSRSHEREMLGPGLRCADVEQPRELLQAPRLDGKRRSKPERDRMERDRQLRRKRRSERAADASRRKLSAMISTRSISSAWHRMLAE